MTPSLPHPFGQPKGLVEKQEADPYLPHKEVKPRRRQVPGMGVQTYEWPSLRGQEELQGAGGRTLGPLVGRQFCSWGFGPLMVSLPLDPQSSITAGSLVPFERGNPHRGPGISFIPRKTRRSPREANKPIKRPARPAAGASPALISRGVSGLSCWEGTGRPSYTLLCDRQCQKIKEIKPSGSPATPPPRMRAAARRRLRYRAGGQEDTFHGAQACRSCLQ